MASLRILALWVGLVAAAHTTTADDDAPTQELTPSAPVARLLSREMPHTFRLELLPGQYVRLLVTKADLNLQLTVTEPSGRRLCEFVSWRYGTLRGSLVAANGGTHLLEVRSLEGDATAREYVIEVGELRAATERDMGDAAASQTHAEAERLRAEWAADSLREAIGRYAEAAAGWRANGSLREASGALLDAGDTAFTLSDYDAALDFYRRALALSRAAGDERGAAAALNSIGYVHSNTDNTGRALSYFRAVSALYRSRRPGRPPDEDLRGAAGLSNNVGEVYYYRGDLPRAKGYFNRALRDFAAAGDRRGQALADLNLGYTYLDSGDLYNSQAHLARALALWRAVNDKRGEALTTTAQGMLASFRGEKQSAFGAYKGAIQMFRAIGDRQGEAAALNSAGKAYEDLNEFESSLDQYTQALQLFQETGNADAEAVTQYYVGRAYHSLNDDERALRHYGESLSLSRRLGKRRIEQYVLTDMASIHAGRGQRPRALSEYGRVLRLYRGANDRRSYAHVLSSMADVYASPPTRTKALRLYRRALALVRAAGYHEAEASTLYKLARAERDSGDLPRARADVQAAIRISESLRTKVARRDLRSSYFASAHDQYVLYTDLLMRMHSQRPSEGFAAAALQASESARARMLLDILSEAEVDIRQGVAPELLERERSLQQSLAAKAESHALLRAAGDSEQEADEMEKEVRRLTTEYQEVTADIREQGLRNAYIVPPSALSLEEIQKELLDEDTLLLEYVLGDEKSYLWAVTPTSFSSYELPPGSEIGDAAGEVYRLLVTGREAGEEASADEQYWRAASAMSRMLLGGVASQLGRKRLLIVADGPLQYIPFEALPEPAPPGAEGSAPLVLNHEVVSLPSATTLAALRRRSARPSGGAGRLVSVLADPVFEADDPRFQQRAAGDTLDTAGGETARRGFDLKEVGGAGVALTRLPFTLQEARAIMETMPAGQGQMVVGFQANREFAVGGGLDGYRVVHFATHGIIDRRHPELSGIVLSMFNERRGRENGFLQLHDIYGLRLSAELVVLSACNTGLGKDMRGDGLIGLTQGFMHAGASSVVASLWKVDDRATAELMHHFYRAMFRDGLAPAAALREAKRALWQGGRWRSPYYWAAFVLQGEYRQSIKAPPNARGGGPPAFAIIIPLLSLLLIAALLGAAKRRRARVP